MLQLAIEGLKPMYANIKEAIDIAYPNECEEREDAENSLECLCAMNLAQTTTYKGMSFPEVIANVEKDMRFVSGKMTDEEAAERIKFHWDLIKM